MYEIDYILTPATQDSEIRRFCWAAWALDAGNRTIQFRGTSTFNTDDGSFFAEASASPMTREDFGSAEWHAKTESMEHAVALHVSERIRDFLEGSAPDLRERLHTVDDADFEEYAF